MKKITKSKWKVFTEVAKIVMGPTVTNQKTQQWNSNFLKREAKKRGISEEQVLRFYKPKKIKNENK